MPRKILVLIGILVILAVLLFKSTSAPTTAAPPPSTNPTKRLAARPPPTQVLPKTLQAGSEATATAEDQIGLKRAGYVSAKGKVRMVELRLEPRAACHTGDLDILRAAAAASNLPIIVSLEPMMGKAGGGTAQTLRFASLLRGVRLRLAVRNAELALVGLFICTDRSGRGRCRGKAAANMSALSPPANQGDHVFYFQALILDQQKFMHVQSTGGALSNLQAYLNARSPAAKRGFKLTEVRQLSEALGSLPLTSTPNLDQNGSTLHATLPYLHLERCAKRQVTVPL